MQVLRLLAARRFRRRAVMSTITASATAPATQCSCGYYGYGEDEGPFFDLDLSSCCSAPASSAESGSESEDSSCAAAEADFVISLHRSRSSASHSSSSYERLSFGGCGAPPPVRLKFCASEPNDAAARFSASCRRGKLRTLSFGSAKAAFYGGRASFSRSSSSARSARLFTAAAYGGSPDQEAEEEAKGPPSASRDVIRRYLSKISRRLRRVAPGGGSVLVVATSPGRLAPREAGRHRQRHRALQGVVPPCVRVGVRLIAAALAERSRNVKRPSERTLV